MYKISNISHKLQKSSLQKCLNIQNKQQYISLGLGLPSKQSFISKIDINMLETQYSSPSPILKSHIKNLLKLRQIDTNESNIFITSGAQQAISLLLQLFCDKGDSVICEEYTYTGFISATEALSIKAEKIEQDFSSGINVDEVEHRIKSLPKPPKLIYLIPDGQNPTGSSLSYEKRERLAKISDKYGIPIIEDDAYGFLNYDNFKKTIFSLNNANTFYIGSFSKILAPSLRVGWIITPREFYEKLSIFKEASDINTSNIGASILEAYLEKKDFYSYISKSIDQYRKKRDLMKNMLDKDFSNYAEYFTPESGMYFWLKLKNNIDSFELHKKALNNNLIIMPGIGFGESRKNPAKQFIRLNFSHPNKDDIIEGIARLKKSILEIS